MPPKTRRRRLYDAAWAMAPHGLILEVGTYCGKSATWLGAAAKQRGGRVVTIDHHRGSEENQAGWEHHDTELVDPGNRDDGHPAVLPPDDARRRARRRRDRDHRRRARRLRRCGRRRSRCCSSTAATPRSTPRPTTRTGPGFVMPRRRARDPRRLRGPGGRRPGAVPHLPASDQRRLQRSKASRKPEGPPSLTPLRG